MQPAIRSIKQLTCQDGRSLAIHTSISLTPTSKSRTDETTLVQPAIQFDHDFARNCDHKRTQTNQCILYKREPSQVQILQEQQQNRICKLGLRALLHDDKELDDDLGKGPDQRPASSHTCQRCTCSSKHHLACCVSTSLPEK